METETGRISAKGDLIVLVADASESAASLWSQTAQALRAVTSALSEDARCALYVLGCDAPLDAGVLDGDEIEFPYRQARHCSLIAPVMQALLRHYQPVQALIVIGNGQIWDLADWADCPLVHQWLLLQVGSDSLQSRGLSLTEYPAAQWETALSRLRDSASPALLPRETVASAWSSSSYTWDVDRTGFPLIYFESLDLHAHLFPVAKAQFERLLWECNPPDWGDARYEELLALNPRAAPTEIHKQPYERLFLTGILPGEIPDFSHWLGQGYDLPTVEEWAAIYDWLAQQPVTAPPRALIDKGLSQVAERLWLKVQALHQPTTLLDLSLMARGVIEWVRDPDADRYVGMGQPRSSFFETIVDGPLVPIDPTRRLRHFGFRLRRRGL